MYCPILGNYSNSKKKKIPNGRIYAKFLQLENYTTNIFDRYMINMQLYRRIHIDYANSMPLLSICDAHTRYQNKLISEKKKINANHFQCIDEIFRGMYSLLNQNEHFKLNLKMNTLIHVSVNHARTLHDEKAKNHTKHEIQCGAN